MPIILIGISIAVFFAFFNPIYNNIGKLRAQVASYDEALKNSKKLENERDKLTAKKNAIDAENLAKLKKLLPENIDNIRLILEIEKIASPYGMVLKDVKYNPTSKDKKDVGSESTGVAQGDGAVQSAPKDYGVWDLEFSTMGTYNNFLSFIRDLENNLRIVDISAIDFSSNTGTGTGTGTGASAGASGGSSSTSSSSSAGFYKYDFKIKTYWLKN